MSKQPDLFTKLPTQRELEIKPELKTKGNRRHRRVASLARALRHQLEVRP